MKKQSNIRIMVLKHPKINGLFKINLYDFNKKAIKNE